MLAPLGVALRIEFDSPDWVGPVRDACESWDTEADSSARSLRIELRRHHALAGTGDVRIEATTASLRLAGAGVDGWADAHGGRAVCHLSDAYLRSPELLRDAVLEPLALFLVTRSGRTPIHAAGVVADGLAILLAGPSGSGKSCLAVAADSAGLEVLSDDTVYLQRRPELRLWSWGGPAHLFADDIGVPRGLARIRNGRTKYPVQLRSPPSGPRGGKVAMVLLEPGDRTALAALRPDEAMRRLAPLEPGFDLLRADIDAAHRLLAGQGAWLLTLSKNPAEAIALLVRNLGRLRTDAAG